MTDTRLTGAEDAFERLKDLLREMFQLDRGGLDFGLYRIMNMKAGEIEAFLDRDLLPQVKTVLAGASEEERASREQALAEARQSARGLGIDPDTAPKVIELQQRLAEARSDADAEADVYSHLANFFARYYAEGDFMSLRRYSGGSRSAYLIPYDGEEVKLHWANADQYYIKTTENYAAYAFTAGEGDAVRRVRFEIAAADNEKDNVKEADSKRRRFVLAPGSSAVARDGGDLAVRFEHRPLTEAEKKAWGGNGARQQGRINEASAAQVLDALDPDWRAALAASAPTEVDPERTLLARHIERYTAKNSFDYFIHKDLGGFLRRELDFYLKNEVLNLDDLALGDADRLHRTLARMRAVRDVAGKIIAFLAQLEDFQKRLWLKKKFVLETQWCVTLDRVSEALYPEIAASEAQRREWVDLFTINEIAGDLCNGGAGYGEPLSVDFLKANPYLVLDTRHFGADFKDRLLSTLPDAGPLDEQTDGLLLHGENFQALNLLQARYGAQVKCIYIDPPYNTNSSEFLYKDGYPGSSWASMLSSRTLLARRLMSRDGLFFMQIGDEESARSRLLLDGIFLERKNTVAVRRGIKNVQAQFSDITRLSGGHDVLHIYAKTSDLRIPHLMQIHDVKKPGKWDTFWRGTDRHTLRYEIFNQEPETGQWRWEKQRTIQAIQNYKKYIETYSENKTLDEWYVENLQAGFDLDFVRRNENSVVQYYIPPQGHRLISDNWLDVSTGGTFTNFATEKHTALLQRIVSWNTSEYDAVLDFFAGSGSTGHAVIDLNRQDNGQRKYILVEMGDHFDTVLLPRLKKVAYAPDWKDGKPVSRDKGVTQLIKYIRLESYEDTLDGLVLTLPDDDLLAANDPALAEDYRLRYALGAETTGSPCLLGANFADPAAYTLSVVRDGARRDAPADLPETFNYLLGLRVESRRRLDGVLAIAGTDAQGRRCLILWRDLEKMNNAALDLWFADNRANFPAPLDLVYVNGDHTLNAIRPSGDTWTAETIEPLFRELIFEGNAG